MDREAYMLEVCRYVELNPVRAAMVPSVADWPWSSYRGHVGLADSPTWLGSNELLGYLLGRDVESAADCAQAQRLYAGLVAAGHGVALWDESLNRQIYLGDDQFVGRMLEAALPSAKRSTPVPKVQRSVTRSLADWLVHCGSRDEALRRAYTESGLSMSSMAVELGLTVGRISQLIARAEKREKKERQGGINLRPDPEFRI